MTTALVFGTFDNLHEGHKAFLREAKRHCEKLVASVPNNETVERLKHREPSQSFSERSRTLRDSGLVDEIVQSDEERGTYHVIEEINPDVIILGYDQDELAHDINRWFGKNDRHMRIITAAAFEPEKYKSSLLKENL